MHRSLPSKLTRKNKVVLSTEVVVSFTKQLSCHNYKHRIATECMDVSEAKDCCCPETHDAAFMRHYECLKKLHEQGASWDPETIGYIAANNDLEWLKFAVANGCPWDPQTTSFAAGHGSLKCLIFAHENEAPWHPDTAKFAAEYKHLECLEYIYENCGDVCPWVGSGLEDFEKSEFSSDIKEYLRSIEKSWKNGENISVAPKPAKRT